MKVLLRRLIVTAIIFLSWASYAYAQEAQVSVVVYFQKESAIFEHDYRDNGIRLEEFLRKINEYQNSSSLIGIHIESFGTSSPEGDTLFNEIISRARASSVRNQILKHTDITEELLFETHASQDWELLAELVEADPQVTSKDRILNIIRNGRADRFERMQEIEYARPFWYIYHNIFPDMRACRITAYYKIIDPIKPLDPIYQNHIEREDLTGIIWTRPTPEIATDIRPASEANVHQSPATGQDPWTQKLTIKTNVIGWGLSAMNVAAEINIAENWSINLPFYYSGTNYFTKTLKFRCAVLQPEVRYDIPQLRGLYTGAHLGVGWFNFALGGVYRIQDAGGKRPAWGGGLSVGYKMAFKSNPRWGMEFALGAGIYDAKYDKFYNEPNGPYAEKGIHKTFIGIDNAAVSLTYNFDLKKKEGRR